MKPRKRRIISPSSIPVRKIFFLILIALSCVAFVFALGRINIGKVTCESSAGNCSVLIKEKLSKFEGRGLIKSYRAIGSLLKNEPSILNYRLQYFPLNNLSVHISESAPEYVITNSAGDYYELVDEDGRVLGLTDSSNLPKLVVDQKIDVSSTVSADYLFALRLLSDVSKTYNIDVGKIESNSFVVELKNGLKVIFPLNGDSQVLMGSLILIYNDIESGESKLNTNGQIIDTIDLRFKNPVLKVRGTP